MHDPEAANVAVVPLTVQTLVVCEAKETVRPELAVATNVNGVPTVCVPGLLKVIVCGVSEPFVAPLPVSIMRLDTFTGSKSDKWRLVRHARSLSFQRASGVPIRPPLIPLSERMIP